MFHILYVIYCIIFIKGACTKKLITTTIHSYYFSERIKVYVGDTIQLNMNVNTQTTWFFKNLIKNHSSTEMDIGVLQAKDQSLIIGQHTLKGDEMLDIFYLEDNESYKIMFSYLLLHDPPSDYHGIRGELAFPYKSNNIKNTLVYVYKQKGFIDHLAFGLKRDTKQKLLKIGGLEEEDTDKKTHSYFDVEGNTVQWGCLVSQAFIQFGSIREGFKTDASNNYGYMDTTDETLTVPPQFFDIILSHYTAAIEQKLCDVYTFNNKKRQLNCYNLHTLRIGRIIIQIGNYEYIMNISDLWICENEDDCEFVIMDDPINNHWRLGSRFYYKTNVLFDYEDKRVHFYANPDSINQLNNEETKALPSFHYSSYSILLVVTVLLGIGLILLTTIRVLFKNDI